jgi:hypothetical protein
VTKVSWPFILLRAEDGTIRVVRVTVACLVVSVALAAQQRDLPALNAGERADLARVLDEAVRRRRSGDPRAQWEGHFLRGRNGLTYVPYTLRLRGVGDAYATAAVGVRVIGWNYFFADGFATSTEADGDDRIFQGAFALQPGRSTVYLAIRDRNDRSSRPVLAERVVVVPGFDKRLRLSSVIVIDRVEPQPEEAPQRPYLLGRMLLVPAGRSLFTRRDSLTVAFQVYNAATFEDGRPDVEVHYRVSKEGGDRRALAATEPQLFNQETLPEEFDQKQGHQLTPVQSLPLEQFEPGEYRLQIDVEDHLGGARADAEVRFTIVQ